MFRGHSQRSLDPKGRLMLPPEFREEILRQSPEGKLILTKLDDCIFGYPLLEWERIEKSLKINTLDKRMRSFQRFFLAGAVEAVLDKQGRILIAPNLRAYAALDKEVILAGVADKFEIWDVARFEEASRKAEESFDEDMMALADAGFELRF